MKTRDILISIFVAFIWGFNFVVIKIGLNEFPPLLFSGLRFSLSAFPAVLFIKRDNIEWHWILMIGIILGTVMFSLLFIGMDLGMPAGLSSLVLQVQGLFTIILSAVILKDRPTKRQLIGISIAFSGITILIIDMYGSTSSSLTGLIFVLFAALAWAISNIVIKKAPDINMFRLMVWMSIVPPIPLILTSIMIEHGQIRALAYLTFKGAFAIFYTSIVSTVLAFGLWGKLFSKYSANIVAPFSFLVPVFGMASSWIVLNEPVSANELLSSICIIFGLLTVAFPKKV